MSRAVYKLGAGLILSLLVSAAAYSQNAPASWSTQGFSGCSDQYGSFDAFIPGMRGFGTCNRGGFVPNTNVILVTNKNTSGTGSLPAAIAAACPKVILFAISGRFSIPPQTGNDCAHWSMVGASAPGNVVISGSTGNPQWEPRGDDYTIDNLTIAPGDTLITAGTLGNRDAFDFHYGPAGDPNAGGNNVILFNNAFIWGTDETLTCYSVEPMTNVTYWQNVVGVGVVPEHNLNHLIGSWCTRHSVIRQVTLHSDGRNPLTRADDLLVANNYLYNPGFQSVMLQPCGTGQNQRYTHNETNIISNLMVRGPNTNGHAYIQQQDLNCLGAGQTVIYDAGNAVKNGVTGAIENCSNHGCFSGTPPTSWAGAPIPNALPTGYVPETIGNALNDADLLAFGQKLMAFAGPRPADRLPYLQSLLDEATNGLDGSGPLGSFATDTNSEGGIASITPPQATWDPTSGGDNPCREDMPTGAAANAITTSGRTRLHEWIIGCFYDNVMPGGYREDALQYYPAPDGPTPIGGDPVAKPSPPSTLQVS